MLESMKEVTASDQAGTRGSKIAPTRSFFADTTHDYLVGRLLGCHQPIGIAVAVDHLEGNIAAEKHAPLVHIGYTILS